MTIAAAIGTVVLTVLVLNLASGEKRVEAPVAHAYGIADPQFLRAMGVLLGPRSSKATASKHC